MNNLLLAAFIAVSIVSILFFANRYNTAGPAARSRMVWAAVGSAALATAVGLLLAAR